MARLGDVCEILDSRRIPITASDREPGPYPYYGANGVQDYVAGYIFDDELVLLAEDGGNFGSKEKPIAYRVSGKCWVNNHAHVLKPKSGLDVDYLCYSLMYYDVSGLVNGATRQKLTQADMRTMEIPVPSPEIQRHITAVLDKVSGLIALRKQQLAKLDELVKARFVEMFGDSKINPKHWAKKPLETIAFVGSSKRVFVEELQDKGIPFYRGTEIGALATGETVIPELFITEKHYRELCAASGTPKRGDLLMPSICPDGRIWCVDTDEPFYFKDGRVLWVHPTDNMVESIYLLYALKEKIISDYINIASGTTFAELKIFALKGLEVMIPPVPLQKSFSDFIQAVHMEQLTIQQGLDKLEIMKKALMQEYFGEVNA